MMRENSFDTGTEIPVEFGEKANEVGRGATDERAKSQAEEEPVATTATDSGASEESSQQAPEFDERYIRLLADFENYRKRVRERESEVAREAEARLIEKLLPVIDDLERMLEHVSEQDGALATGARLIYQKLLGVLKAQGLEAVNGLEEEFNPEVHHAIQMVPVDDPRLDGKVVAIAKKGYRYKNRLLRPADVLVGKYSDASSD